MYVLRLNGLSLGNLFKNLTCNVAIFFTHTFQIQSLLKDNVFMVLLTVSRSWGLIMEPFSRFEKKN